ncbi:MAG: tRNA (guanosine(46)-N7)-methyltransferase TrmB [Chitinophagales bacterium]|nr:tRNA (guanosine(46)-N7)-methyltransferase TrmB [Chitinophagales bacterium]
MAQNKLVRFEAINKYTNVLQYPKDIKGSWHTFFNNNNPITLELACGKGEYSVNLGRQNKDKNYLGVDIKGNRIYIGAKQALEEELTNVGFLRTHILQIEDYFQPGEIEAIWIIFPDPFLRESREKNRLTHPRFLYRYQHILPPGGVINLKTDSKELYEYTLEVIAQNNCTIKENIADIYGKGKATGPLAIQTFYEKMHLAEGRTIYYLAFTLPETEIEVEERYKTHKAIDTRD